MARSMYPRRLLRLGRYLLAGMAVVSALWAPEALALSPRHVLVVINANAPESRTVGEHYARRRDIGEEAVLRLPMPVAEEISREDYLRHIETPLAAWLARHAAQDRILCIVLARGVPLRISGTAGRQGTVASVDSELALLYRKMVGRPVPAAGPTPNPYFLGSAPVGEARPFAREAHDIYLVTRLDGFTAADAMALVDRALAADSTHGRTGRVVLDMKAALDERGNAWLQAAADRLGAQGVGDRVVLETTSRVVRDEGDLIGYFSWGSNDPAITERDLGLRFLPGAVAGLFVSTDARTFREPPPDWRFGSWDRRESWFGGSPQSLAGDLVRQGVTGLAAYVAEPYLDGTVRPDILLPAYLAGFTLAEAFYLAMPSLSWQGIVLGDPLARVADLPGRTAPADVPIDPATELPAVFARRRLETLGGPGTRPEAVRAWLRAQAREARDDLAGAREALEEATRIDPGLRAAQLALAQAYDRAGEHALAMERYRAVLKQHPNDIVALNNLAFGLAVHARQPGDALPLAERAYALARGNANVADTLAWVHHLLGRKAEAGRYIAEALRGDPQNGEIRLHAAAILLSAGDLEGARRELTRALELDPALETRRADDVRSLREAVR